MGVDEAVWASVRRAHEETVEPAAQFCRRLGVSARTYYHRRKSEAWATRPDPKNGQSKIKLGRTSSETSPVDACAPNLTKHDLADGGSAPGTRAGGSEPVRRVLPTRLTKRLYVAIDTELHRLEASADDGAASTVADNERRTRTLMNMIRGLEKVLELDTDKEKPKRGRSKRSAGQSAETQQPAVSDDDAERMRQDIADRLKRLHAQWADTSGSSGA